MMLICILLLLFAVAALAYACYVFILIKIDQAKRKRSMMLGALLILGVGFLYTLVKMTVDEGKKNEKK